MQAIPKMLSTVMGPGLNLVVVSMGALLAVTLLVGGVYYLIKFIKNNKEKQIKQEVYRLSHDKSLGSLCTRLSPALQKQIKNYTCPICLGIIREPVETQCGHIFQKECLQHHLQGKSKPCPVCRQLIEFEPIERVDIKRKISILQNHAKIQLKGKKKLSLFSNKRKIKMMSTLRHS